MLLIALLVLQAAVSAAADGSRPAVRSKASGKLSRKRPQLVQAVALSQPGLDVEDFTYEQPAQLASDSVDVEVHACSLSSADVQQLRGDWGACPLPLVPGREAVGVVTAVGSAVKGMAPGQRVGLLLGTGMDSENEEDGADRAALDAVTIGAASHHLRVPARWAFPLPPALPSVHAAGLMCTGGAVWCQLVQRRLPRSLKVAVVGDGAAGELAARMAVALGFETYTMSLGASDAPASDAADAADAAGTSPIRGVRESLDTSNDEHLRLHGGSFDVLLCTSSQEQLTLSPALGFLKRGGALFLAGRVRITFLARR